MPFCSKCGNGLTEVKLADIMKAAGISKSFASSPVRREHAARVDVGGVVSTHKVSKSSRSDIGPEHPMHKSRIAISKR